MLGIFTVGFANNPLWWWWWYWGWCWWRAWRWWSGLREWRPGSEVDLDVDENHDADGDDDYYAVDEGRVDGNDGCDHDVGEEGDDDGQGVESENLAAKYILM